jgi:hypothetical protein
MKARRTPSILAAAAALGVLVALLEFWGRSPGSTADHKARPSTELSPSHQMQPAQDQRSPQNSLGPPSRTDVTVRDTLLEALVRDLLFNGNKEAKAASEIIQSTSVHLFEPDAVCHYILCDLISDSDASPRKLTNSNYVEETLLLVGNAKLAAMPLVNTYVTVDIDQEFHARLQKVLRSWLQLLNNANIQHFLEHWQEMKPQDVGTQLRDLFAKNSTLAGFIATTMMETAIMHESQAHAVEIGNCIIDLAIPKDVSPLIMQAMRDIQVRTGQGIVNNTALLCAQKLALAMAASRERRESWTESMLSEIDQNCENSGSAMMVVLLAASDPLDPRGLPALQEVMTTSCDTTIRAMVLTNVGRIADADTVVALGTRNGVNLENIPRTTDEVYLQSALATALVNTLTWRPQDEEDVGKAIAGAFANWSQDKRCYDNLVFLIDTLGVHKIQRLTSALNQLAASSVSRIAAAASRTLASWNSR